MTTALIILAVLLNVMSVLSLFLVIRLRKDEHALVVAQRQVDRGYQLWVDENEKRLKAEITMETFKESAEHFRRLFQEVTGVLAQRNKELAELQEKGKLE